jgi:hypothetical protein
VTTRRVFLGLLAGAPFLAGVRSDAREPVLPRLIKQAHEHGDLGRRIDFISRALLGTRYQAHTLIGGPRRKEQFVLRDDAFDCVTYCEAVLAAAMADDFADYPGILRRIRYAQGEVRWAERNHDFAQWSRRMVENNLCRPVGIEPSTTVEKTLHGGGLGRRHYAISATHAPTLIANRKALRAGDVIGFVSRRSELDYFHTGFIAFDRRGALLLRHASQSRGKVVNEDMAGFVAATGVKYVTLLRAQERAFAQN